MNGPAKVLESPAGPPDMELLIEQASNNSNDIIRSNRSEAVQKETYVVSTYLFHH